MAKDLTQRGVFLKKNESGIIQVVNVYDVVDECSPDGISFMYDAFDIFTDNRIEECDGGCYWGYNSAMELLNDFFELDKMIEVFDERIDDMIHENLFDYNYLLNKLLTK